MSKILQPTSAINRGFPGSLRQRYASRAVPARSAPLQTEEKYIGGLNMKFSTVCMLGIVVLVPFGLAFLLSPAMTGAFYGIGGWTEGTGFVARLFGLHLLYSGAANLAVMNSPDAALHRRFSVMSGALSALGAIASALTALRPGISPALWSTVAIYVFFAAAWGAIAVRGVVDDDDGENSDFPPEMR